MVFIMAQSSTSGTSSRRHGREQDTASITSSRIGDIAEWEANEALRQRELEEAKGRAAQMEKTMRWWSDCTANWREKWSKVRNERNKAREECKQLRSKLEASLKDASSHKSEKEQLELQNDQLKKEIEKIHILLLKHAGQFDSQIFEALSDDLQKEFTFSTNGSPVKDRLRENGVSSSQSNPECDSTALNDLERDSRLLGDYVLQGAVPKHPSSTKDGERSIDLFNEDKKDEEYVIQKLSMLQLRLDEASKTIQIEREEKYALHRNIERLTSEVQELKDKCEELREAKQDTMRELLNLQDEHEKELEIVKADLHDEASSREGMDKRLNDLRAELERLQTENATEWGKRERLETEKLALERDNKKLRSELRDMQERIERRGNRPVPNTDAEYRHLQQELTDKNKEISELKHSQNKLRKMLQDKVTESAHAVRRAEQYEAEVKKLRVRVEELKRDLAAAEDDLDTTTNNMRKLQRSNDELQEQVDNFQVQLQHLHTRLRNCSSSSLLSHRGSLLLDDRSDEELNEYL